MSRRGWVLFVTMGVIWGIPYLLIKVAVGGLAPASLVFLRTGLGALLLLPIALLRGQVRPLLPRWRPLLAYTIAELAVPWLLLSTAEKRLSSSLSGLLIAVVPMVGALLGWLTGGERLGARRQFGLAIGLAGVAALIGLDLGRGDTLALVEMAFVTVGYAVGPFILARYLADLPGMGVVAGSLALAALMYLPVGVLQLPRHWPGTRVVASLVVLAVVCTAAAFLIFFALIDEVGPVRATVIPYLNPAVAVALGVSLLGEPFTPGIGIGFVLVIIGSVLATHRSPVPAPPAVSAQPIPAPVPEP